MSDVDPQPGTASPWFKTLRGKVVLGAGGVVVVAAVVVVIVVTQVVVPNRQAAQAAAASASAASASAASASAASVKAEGDLAAAHLAFGTASKACADANKQLSDAITSAQATAGTDPSTMQDPTLIDRLNQAITAAQAVVPCTPPTMATDTDAITQQTTQMGTDTQAVTSEVQNLGADSQSVQASVQTKKTATSQVAASAAAKAQTGSTTWTSDDGYVYGISWSGVGLKATIDPTQGAPGQLVVSYSVFGTVTVTNQTRGKQAPMVWVALNSIYPKSASDLFCDTDCQSWLEFSGNLGGQQVSSFGRLSYALHTYPDPQSLNSPPTGRMPRRTRR
jgi:hypothetical protein